MEQRKKKIAQASEHIEQAALIHWWKHAAPPVLEPLLFAIPNGGYRSARTGARMKAEGVRPGVPDLFLACPGKGGSGLWIELKRQKGGRLSPAQTSMLEALAMQGFAVSVCHGWEQAKKTICTYLGWKESDPVLKL